MKVFVGLILTLAEGSVAFSSPPANRCKVQDPLPRLQSALKDDELGRMANNNNMTRLEFLIKTGCAAASFPTIANAANLPQNNGADLSRTGSLDTLVPILQMKGAILTAKDTINENEIKQSNSVPPEICSAVIKELLQSIPREEKQFKRIFDAYSTPVSYKQKFLDQNAFLVYYSKGFDGPGRPNIENAGSDVENSIQTMQYGFRNEAWTAIDNLFTELEYGSKGTGDNVDVGELSDLISNAAKSFDLYLSLAPEEDVKEASNMAGA